MFDSLSDRELLARFAKEIARSVLTLEPGKELLDDATESCGAELLRRMSAAREENNA